MASLLAGGVWLAVFAAGRGDNPSMPAARSNAQVSSVPPDESSDDLSSPPAGRPPDAAASVRIAKWYADHAAAISLTYDDYVDTKRSLRVQQVVIEQGSQLDYELCTATVTPKRRRHLREAMLPQGFQFYGHGHEHLWHDRLTYDAALQSFRTCYQQMESLGLKPVAYAYPYGAGEKPTTRRALAAAGFLSGRLFERHLSDPFIVPGDVLAPPDWFGLPTLVMMNERAFSFAADFVNNTGELIPYLEQALRRRAWLIATYHSIGDEEGWGYYALDDFQQDLRAVSQRDFWVASMNDATLYVREREKARATARWVAAASETDWELEVQLEDDLPNDRFDQPLTLVVSLPPTWSDHSVEVFQGEQMVTGSTVIEGQVVVSLVPNELPYRVRKRPRRPF